MPMRPMRCLFPVRTFEEYGKLSGRKIDDMVSALGSKSTSGRRPTRFALWKAAKPGEPTWPSPWSDGRPGWHIECSPCAHITWVGRSISTRRHRSHLPHHENEIAQSEAFLAWRRCALLDAQWHVAVGGDKMSKSIGNVIRIRDLIEGGNTQPFG